MDELLQHLEEKIRSLIGDHQQMKDKNLELSKGKLSLLREKEELHTQQQKAIAQIENLVTKLKMIENAS